MFSELYKAVTYVTLPLISVLLEKRKNDGKEDLARFNERVGEPTLSRPEGPLFWLHGASVGESVSMIPLVEELLKQNETAHVMVTTGTVTSAKLMGERLPQRAFHQFYPVDCAPYVNKFLEHWKPDMALWFESEFWPNMINAIADKKIPLILVNGRISNRSFNRWKIFRFLIAEILSKFTLCLGQTEEDAHRLYVLGAKKTDCVGNLKYAADSLPLDKDKFEKLKKLIGERTTWLASSTHYNEELQIAEAHMEIKKLFPDLLTIIVPRHPNRGEEIQKDIENQFMLKTSRRSINEDIYVDTDIYIADTIGELGIFYRLAPIVFIGGSLIPFGGQNMLEAARLNCALISGINMQNFREMNERALEKDAIRNVIDKQELADKVIELLKNPDELKQKSAMARQFAEGESAVLERTIEVILPLIK